MPMVQEKVNAGQPGLSWKFASGHECEKTLGQVGLGLRRQIHTLHSPGLPLCVARVVSIGEICWLLVLVVVVGEHIGVVGDAAGIAESLGTGAVGIESSGAVDEVEPVGLRGHFGGIKESTSREGDRDK